MLIAGSQNLYNTWKLHGWSYKVKTIIGETEVIRSVSLNEQVILLAFIVWMIVCIFILLSEIHLLEQQIKFKDIE